jgi:hypothetical protein
LRGGLRLFFGGASGKDRDTGQNLELIRRAAEFFHPAFHIGIESLRVLDGRLRGEDGIGDAGRDLARGLADARGRP